MDERWNTDNAAAKDAVMALRDAVGAGRVVWGNLEQLDVLLLLRGEISDDLIFEMIADDGTLYDVRVRKKD